MKFFLIAFFFLLAFSCSETLEYQFKNYTEAEDTIRRGWIPNFIPKESIDIQVKYNLDSNNVIGKFTNVTEDSWQSFLNHCSQEQQIKMNFPTLSSRWWPNDLLDSSLKHTPRFIFYNCTSEKWLFAINTSEKDIFFWKLII